MFTKISLTRWSAVALLAAGALAVASTRAAADEHVTGNITVRSATGFAMQLRSGTPMLVTLTDETKIRQTNDDTHMATTDLVPGLEVDVEGTMDGQGRLVAQKVSFSKEDLQHALEVQAALVPLNQAMSFNTAAIQQLAQKLGVELGTVEQYAGTLNRYQSQLSDYDARIVATSGSIAATNARFMNLEDYNVIDTMTIYFANGSATLPKDAAEKIAAFAAKSRGVTAYRLAVEGHASAVGPIPYNTTLSHLRAEAVTAALQQHGVPTANIFVPAALGTTAQVAENTTAKGQAENRRVVVTLLQNKGLAQK